MRIMTNIRWYPFALLLLLIACSGESAEEGRSGAETDTATSGESGRSMTTDERSAAGLPAIDEDEDMVPEPFGDTGFSGTIRDRSGGGAGIEGGLARLAAVRTGSHGDRSESFDRIVFEFVERIPAWQIAYVDKPVRACGSGDPHWPAGDARLEIRFDGAVAHTDEGHPTVADRNRSPDLPNLKQLLLLCDFEGTVTWVLGVTSPEEYRVIELADPPRVVVDVRHR